MIIRLQASGGSFRGAGLYYLHDKQLEAGADQGLNTDLKPTTDARVWFTATRNCLEQEPARALDEMWRTAEHQAELKMTAGVKRGGRVCEDPVKTISLSWHKDDAPEPEHMIESADKFLQHMGWEAHQAVFVAHNDTPHRHIHIILNRVNPDTGRTLDDFREQKRAQVWALEYERAHDQIRCEQREANATGKAPVGKERDVSADQQQQVAMPAMAPAPIKAANDHLPHNVIMLARPHEREFQAYEALRQAHELIDRAELKVEQRAERQAFFKDGSKLFKATRHAVYDEVRKQYAPEWAQFYKDQKMAKELAKEASATAIGRAHYFAHQGRWEEAGEAFSDRDSVRKDVAKELATVKADLKLRQTKDLRERQRDACDALREVRDVQYQELLQRQREERGALIASEALQASGMGAEPVRSAEPANQNRTVSAASPEPARTTAADPPARDGVKADALQRAALTFEAMQSVAETARSENSTRVHESTVQGPTPVSAEATHQVSDLAAGAIGGIASYLADQLGELFAPTPPEVRAAQAKEDAKREAERPPPEDKSAAYARIIDDVARIIEAEREQEGQAWWTERERGKGRGRDR